MDAHLQTVTVPPLLPQPPACPTTSFENKLRVGLAHAIPHEEALLCVKFSQDGKYLAAGCQDGKSYIYDVQTATLIHVFGNQPAENDAINAVCFSHDGKYLATGSSKGSINVWDMSTKSVRNTFEGFTSWIRSLDFSPDGKTLASTSENFVRLWNMSDGTTMDLTDGNTGSYYTSAAFSPDGGYVAASHRDGMVRLWNVRAGQLMGRVKAHEGLVYDVKFTPCGKGLVSGDGEAVLKYWNISPWIATFVQTSDLERSVSAPEEETLPERVYSGQLHAGRCLAISPDGRWIAAGSVDALVGIWDAHSAKQQYDLKHCDCVYSVAFSPAGEHLASSERDGTVKIWRYSPITPSDIPVHSISS